MIGVSVCALGVIAASAMTIRYSRQARRNHEHATREFDRATALHQQATRDFQRATQIWTEIATRRRRGGL